MIPCQVCTSLNEKFETNFDVFFCCFTDTTSLDDLPGTDVSDIKKLEVERAKLAAKCKCLSPKTLESQAPKH